MKIQALIVSCLCFTLVAAAGGLNKEPLSLTPSYMFKTFLGLSKDADASKEPPLDLLLIGPGFGRTGTSSFMTALSRIGLKSYHMSAIMRTPGHLKMWNDCIQGKTSVDDVINALKSTAGFNATGSMPACYLYQELPERYPNARVVLTVRGDGDGLA